MSFCIFEFSPALAGPVDGFIDARGRDRLGEWLFALEWVAADLR